MKTFIRSLGLVAFALILFTAGCGRGSHPQTDEDLQDVKPLSQGKPPK